MKLGRPVKSNIIRFWEKVIIPDLDNCWEWAGSCRRHGYGAFGLYLGYPVKSKVVAAHRFIWEYFYGPIPPGLRVLHKCDNPPCCNPGHLFLGTQNDNIQDARNKGRLKFGWKSQPGSKNGNAKINDQIVREIRFLLKIWVYWGCITDISKKLNIPRATIYSIKNNKGWGHVT